MIFQRLAEGVAFIERQGNLQESRGETPPPLASHSAWVVIDPRRPNFGFGPIISCLRPCGAAQKFTCSCHCAMLSGMRWFRSSSVKRLGAVYITPANR